MNKKITIFFISCLLPLTGIAQETSGKYAHLSEGEPAPFDGTLLDPQAMATIAAKRETCEKEAKLNSELECNKQKEELKKERDLALVERDTSQKKREVVEEVKDEEIKRLREVAEDSTDYSSLWFAGGFVAGISLAIGIFWVSVQIVSGGV
jgi:hypothetical protein